MRNGRDDEPTDPMPKKRVVDEPTERDRPDVFAIALASFLAGAVVVMLVIYLTHR
jgi:hypothetical protein